MSDQTLWLEVLGQEGLERALPERGKIVLGGSVKEADIPLDGLADAHCAIGRLKNGGWAIQDLGSRAGTSINGESVRSAKLAHGDVIALGSRRLRVYDPERSEELVFAGNQPPPERLAGFRVEKRIGKGSMGEVFRAEQESLHRPVALKVLCPRLSNDPNFVASFLSEARAAAALSHANVVHVYDVGEADGRHYLAMEYMDQGSLEERVARVGRLPWTEALGVLCDAAAGLQYAEARGIVHRDIKPANLMLSSTGATKIADLGLATTVEAESARELEPGGRKIYGTPHFISPEQARGEAVDVRSDLYSLGATLYRLLTGRTPFEGETTREIVRARFTSEPTPIAELAPEVPSEFARLIEQLLEREPAARPASASALVATSERLRSDLGGTRASSDASSSGALKLVGGMAALALIGGGLWFAGIFDDGPTTPEPPAPSGPTGPTGLLAAGTGGAPALPTGPVVPTGYDAAEETERELQLLDREARIEYRDLDEVTDPSARLAALQLLIERFPGTAAAGEMQLEIEELALAILTNAERASQLAEALAAAEQELLSLVDTEAAPPELYTELSALAEAQSPDDELGETFEAVRARLEDESLQRSIGWGMERSLALSELAQTGDWAGVASGLAELVASLQHPGYADRAGTVADGASFERPAPERIGELLALRQALVVRLEGLAAEEAAWRLERVGLESQLVASIVGINSGFALELAELRLSDATERLLELGAQVVTQESLGRVEVLIALVADARAALELLRTTFAADEWRRRSVLDPRGGRDALDVRGVTVDGLLVQGQDGLEELGWSAFGALPDSLDALYKGRLERNYETAEKRVIARLLELAAVSQTLGELEDLLIVTSGNARLSDSERERVLSGFRLARTWAEETGSDSLEGWALQRDAAIVLMRALQAIGESRPSAAAAQLERLEDELGASLLHVLLSDGRDITPPPPPEPITPFEEEIQPADPGFDGPTGLGGASGEPTEDELPPPPTDDTPPDESSDG